MADHPITKVLSLLRKFRNTADGISLGNSVFDHLKSWCGNDASSLQAAKILVYAASAVADAEDAIRASALDEEAQQGLLQVTAKMREAFTPPGSTQPVSSFFPTLDSSITMFAILSSAIGLPPVGGEALGEVTDLLDEIRNLTAAIDAAGLDPLVHSTALRHLKALETLLRNIDAFGVDAAMAAYFELVTALKRVERGATPETKRKLAEWWPEVERWVGRLTMIDEAVNHGQSLLEHATKIVAHLPHFPALPLG